MRYGLIVGLILLLVVGCEREWSVVKNGECFSYSHGSWVSDNCYNTYNEALKEMKDMIEFHRKYDEHKSRQWEKVNN